MAEGARSSPEGSQIRRPQVRISLHGVAQSGVGPIGFWSQIPQNSQDGTAYGWVSGEPLSFEFDLLFQIALNWRRSNVVNVFQQDLTELVDAAAKIRVVVGWAWCACPAWLSSASKS